MTAVAAIAFGLSGLAGATPASAQIPGAGFNIAGNSGDVGFAYARATGGLSFPIATTVSGSAGTGGGIPLIATGHAIGSAFATFPSTLPLVAANTSGSTNASAGGPGGNASAAARTPAAEGVAVPVTAGGPTSAGSTLNAVLTPSGTTASLCVFGMRDIVAVGLDPIGAGSGCTQGSALIEIGPPSTLSVNEGAAGAGVSGTVGTSGNTVALCIDGSGNTTQASLSLNGQVACGSGSALIQVGPVPLNAGASTIATQSVTVAPQSLTSDAMLCVAGSGTVSAADASTNACAPGITPISVGPVSAPVAGAVTGSSTVPATATLCVDSSGDVTAAGFSVVDVPAAACSAGLASIQVGPA